MISLLLTLTLDSPLPQPATYEDIANVRVTPAIPGGQPFDQPIDLPQTPEPGALLLVGAAVILMGRRHARGSR